MCFYNKTKLDASLYFKQLAFCCQFVIGDVYFAKYLHETWDIYKRHEIFTRDVRYLQETWDI